MNWLCRLIGHEGAESLPWLSDSYVCPRCGDSERSPGFRESRHVLAYYRLKWAIIRRYWNARHWLTKCSTCNRRFNRCPDDDAHLPF